jgi:hypothetical protein
MPAALSAAGRAISINVSLPPDEYAALERVIQNGELRLPTMAAAVRHYFREAFKQAHG